VLLAKMIEERNRGRVPLTKPKNMTIDEVIDLLERHFNQKYKTASPRLPQLAIYAMYECLLRTSSRYTGCSLVPLKHMKTANRKAGSIGDVDVKRDNRPLEAAEVKFEVPIALTHISNAIEKIKTEDVKRYYILSTAGIASDDAAAVLKAAEDFYQANGCEIIVNGVYETLRYYLRTLHSTDEFIISYVNHLATDDMLGYEHRIAWNEACKKSGRG
jgi:DNA (cytosine-5)-methyltransferase 1